jgi:hypothetical protein
MGINRRLLTVLSVSSAILILYKAFKVWTRDRYSKSSAIRLINNLIKGFLHERTGNICSRHVYHLIKVWTNSLCAKFHIVLSLCFPEVIIFIVKMKKRCNAFHLKNWFKVHSLSQTLGIQILLPT